MEGMKSRTFESDSEFFRKHPDLHSYREYIGRYILCIRHITFFILFNNTLHGQGLAGSLLVQNTPWIFIHHNYRSLKMVFSLSNNKCTNSNWSHAIYEAAWIFLPWVLLINYEIMYIRIRIHNIVLHIEPKLYWLNRIFYGNRFYYSKCRILTSFTVPSRLYPEIPIRRCNWIH